MHDKPNRSLAIAYAMKRKAKDKPDNYADGGMARIQEAEESSGYSHEPDVCVDCESGHCNVHGADMMENGGDIIERIMSKNLPHMSKGGRIANDTHGPNDEDLVGFSPNEFDDLALRDDLEFSYTGKNSGDELGNAEQDEDRRDVVARIMRSLRK